MIRSREQQVEGTITQDGKCKDSKLYLVFNQPYPDGTNKKRKSYLGIETLTSLSDQESVEYLKILKLYVKRGLLH